MQPKADMAAKDLKQILEATDTLKNKSDIYYNLGLYNQQQKSYYNIALDFFLKSAALHKSKVDTTSITKVKTDYAVKLMMVAEIYLQLKQPDKALEYLEEARPYLGMSIPVDITAYGKFVRSYVMLKNKPQAQKYYDLLHQTIGRAPGNWSEAVSSSLQLSELALESKDYATAKQYIEKADAQAKKDNKEILTHAVLVSYGNYFMALNDYSNALKYYKIAEPVSIKYNKEEYTAILKSMTEASIMTNNITDALNSFKKYNIVSDSLTAQKVSSNIAEMEAVFQNKNKQQQIKSQHLQLENAGRQRFWLIIGLSLVILSAVLLFVIYRNKKRAADILNKKNGELNRLNDELNAANRTKAKLFSIISHDLRSPINQVYQFLKLQQLNPDALDENQKAALSIKIQNATGSLLETMEDLLLWSKTQMNTFDAKMQLVNIGTVVADCQRLLQLNSDAKRIEYKTGISGELTIQTDTNYLQTIIRNLLQNAIKAAPEDSMIYLETGNLNGKTQLLIKNQGAAFTQQQYEQLIAQEQSAASLSGLGLRLVDELSQKIHANVSFHYDGAYTSTCLEFK
ncbi:MAG: GHKL domain-containing protein [Niabella sp.]|nr:GHKL domain-containing protein [Niabella sp.]